MSRQQPRNRIGKSYEITRLSPDSTGLSYTLLARIDSERLHDNKERHLKFPPRIEIFIAPGKRFALSLTEPFEVVTNRKVATQIEQGELECIRQYLRINQKTLVDHFNAILPDTDDLLDRLQKPE